MATVTIPVSLDATGQLVVPDEQASPGDKVVWVPGDGVDRVINIRFRQNKPNKPPTPPPWPFTPPERAQHDNPSPNQPNLEQPVRQDAEVQKHNNYSIRVKLTGGGTANLDPDLFIVP